MSIQEGYSINKKQLNTELEIILQESEFELEERAQSILIEIETSVLAAKKDVQYYIEELVNQ